MGRSSDEVLRDLLGLQRKIYRVFDEQTARALDRKETVSAHWSPPVDIYETGQEFVLVAEVPGIDQSEIQIEVTNNLLVLRGERPLITSDPSLSYHRIERPNGIFQRVFRLPVEVDPSRVSAICRDGVLRVTLPKSGQNESRFITVDVEE